MSSRKEEKEQRRQERLAREQSEAEQAKRRRTYGVIVGTVLGIAAVAAVVVVVAAGGGSSTSKTGKPEQTFPNAAAVPPQSVASLEQAAKDAGCVLENPPIEGRTHVSDSTKVVYKTSPPTSGNHNPIPAADGYYPVKPPVRHTVHTLEHGRVYIHYKPTLPKHRINQLGGLFNDDPYHMLLSPDNQMPYRVAVTAWGHLAGCKKVTDKTFDVIRAFRDRYRDRGPETVP